MSVPIQRKLNATAKLTTLVIVGAVVGYLASPQHSAAPPAAQLDPAPSRPEQAQTRHSSIAMPPAAASPALGPQRTPAVEPQQADAAAIAIEYLLQGHDLISVGEWAGAVEAFQLAVEIDSTAETNGALGALYFRLAATNGAYRYLKRAVEMDPDDADGWIALANALQLRGNPGESRQALANARHVEPGLAIEHDSSGFAYRADHDPGRVFYASRFIPSDISRRTPQ